MLIYTSSAQEAETNSETVQEIQPAEDEQLIAELEKEIDGLENLNLLKSLNELGDRDRNKNDVFTKREYFKRQLSIRKAYKITFINGTSIRTENTRDIALPSTFSYENYLKRKKAFTQLDNNLKISINEGKFTIRLLDKKDKNLGPGEFLNIKNLKNLTGEEIREVNIKLEQLVYNKGFLVISDDKNGVIIRKQKIKEAPKPNNKKSPFYGQAGESSEREDYNILMAALDRFLTTSSQDSDAPTVGSLIRELADLDEQTDSKLDRIGSLIAKYNALVAERKRLLKISSQDSPIVVNLNQHLADLKEQMKSELGRSVPFAVIEQAPIFPGCEDAVDKKACFQEHVQSHINTHLKYPKEAKEDGIQGDVFLIFTIDKNGAITNIRERSPLKSFGVEAQRIISLLPKMKPGKQDGEVVETPFSTKISFTLDPSARTLPKQEEDEAGKQEVLKRNKVARIDSLLVPFNLVEEVPIFPGCEKATNKVECFQKAMQKHIAVHFRYPKEAQKNKIQGRTSVMFTIGEDGTIQNIEARGPVPQFESEAKRIIKLLPVMKPGRHRDKAVRVPFSIPITFKLN